MERERPSVDGESLGGGAGGAPPSGEGCGGGAVGGLGAAADRGAYGGTGGVPPLGEDVAGHGGGPRWWARPVLVSVTTLAAIAVLTLATIAQSPSAKAGSDATPAAEATATGTAASGATGSGGAATTPSAAPAPTTRSPSPPAPSSPSVAATATATRSTPAQALARAVTAVPGNGNGNLSVAVTDAPGDGGDGTGSGTPGGAATYDSGDDTAYDTASIVKVDILAALLLRDQRAGTQPTAGQRTLATAMIEASDNDATTTLWDTIGRATGLDAANHTLGLRHTAGGAGELWGLTQTTVGDQLALLGAVFGDDSALSATSRAYLTGLMRSITSGQRWGVSAADSDDAGFALKNGWLQRTATGLWDINSIGEVTYQGHRLLICVLSSGQRSEAAGIALVEAVAKAAAKAYVAPGAA